MIFNENFYENSATFNLVLHVRSSGELFPDKTYCIERSSSKTGTIMYITTGRLNLSYGGKTFSLKSGDSFILPPKRDYTIKSSRTDPIGILWVNIRGILFENVYDTLFSDDDFPIRTCNLDKDIRLMFDKMKNPNNFEETAALTIQIMLKIFSSPSSREKNLFNGKTLAGQFEYYISQCVQRGFSMSDMCDYFEMSKDTLIRNFKQALDTTPYQYYQSMRFDIAKSLLTNSVLSIEEIADRLRFNDRNHFTSFFIKAAGISPAKFRQQA